MAYICLIDFDRLISSCLAPCHGTGIVEAIGALFAWSAQALKHHHLPVGFKLLAGCTASPGQPSEILFALTAFHMSVHLRSHFYSSTTQSNVPFSLGNTRIKYDQVHSCLKQRNVYARSLTCTLELGGKATNRYSSLPVTTGRYGLRVQSFNMSPTLAREIGPNRLKGLDGPSTLTI